MPNYQNGKIYKIICNITGETYYGSTTSALYTRKSNHKKSLEYYETGKANHYLKSFDIIKRNDWDMVLVENFPCNGKEELRMRERYYIENNKCVNKSNPIILEEEKEEYLKNYYKQYNIDNRERIATYCKERRNGEKREELLAKKREYHHNNTEKIAEKSKIYREENAEKIKEKKKLDYQKNKEKLQAKVVCECGAEFCFQGMKRHLKTKKHTNNLANKNVE